MEETRKLLFPAIYTIDEEGDVIRFTTRAAFPPIPDPSIIGLIVLALLEDRAPNGRARRA